MLLQVTHETRYDYTPPVETAQHLAHLKPMNTASQRLVSHALTINPTPAQHGESPDVYGNTRAFFALEATHEDLVVTAESVVDTAQPVLSAAIARELPWEEVRERFRYVKDSSYDPASDFVFPSRYVPRHDDFAAYARPSFAPGRPAFDAAMDLTLRMYRDLEYDAGSTEISTPAIEALAQRKGVCQDFAHIMIAIVRGLSIPCRYVSGYLYHGDEHNDRSADGATHAWVEALMPGLGWVGFDPTNDLIAGARHIRTAVGRDYSDVPPTLGTMKGRAETELQVRVRVAPSQTLLPPGEDFAADEEWSLFIEDDEQAQQEYDQQQQQ